MTGQLHVLVAGAGPTGMALALQVADHGASVRIVERRQERFRPSRALIVHPRTLEVLRPFGVTDALLARGDTAPAARLHLGSRIVRARLDEFDLPDTEFPHLLLIRQADVETVLAEALAARGITVERGAELVAIESGGGAAHASIRGGDDADVAYLVGCDGTGSLVRGAAGMRWPGRSYRQEIVLADLQLDGDVEPGVVHAAPTRGGLVFLFALGERAPWRLLATRPAGHDGSAVGALGTGAVRRDDVEALLDRAGFACVVRHVAWSARVPLQHRLADRYRAGPLFIAGDAAHTHSPAGGQGMNTGIQDAANLGWKLAFAARSGVPRAAVETLLDSYECERRPVARRVLAMTRAIFWAEAATDPIARATRAAAARVGPFVLPTLLARRRLLAAGVRELSQLRIRYHCSPISIDATRSGTGLHAGDRLPDADVMTDDGSSRLHGLLAHPGIDVLLGRDASAPDPSSLPPDVRVHRLMSSPGRSVVAVRPDGYIGFCGDSTQLGMLASWLDMVHPGPGEHRLAGSDLVGPGATRSSRTCAQSG